MLINIVIQSWIIGSITLLVVKNDQKTGDYRDALEALKEYSKLHSLPNKLSSSLKTQLKLDFDNEEVADEQVLKHFPLSFRHKILRELYLPCINRTKLMEGVRQQFVDEFLALCRVEIHSPGEDIIERNTISSNLYLLVEGVVELGPFRPKTQGHGGFDDSTVGHGGHCTSGEFINHFSFFTESPELETARTKTICKTLTMERSTYKLIVADHPASAGMILQNLMQMSMSSSPVFAPQSLARLRAGSQFFDDADYSGNHNDSERSYSSKMAGRVRTKIQDLVAMHISKQRDDSTTRLLFAASRGDINTIEIMCSQGFDPNSSDYDSRTALMVAAMKGQIEAVIKLLAHDVDPNIQDVHGTTALFEAARNGHDDVMGVLIKHGGKLCMSESLAASVLCQAVHDGDVLLLNRLLTANINVNAVDYDKRAAIHVASSEGNMAALKLLIENGADLSAKDRWGKTARDAAKESKATHVIEYLSYL